MKKNKSSFTEKDPIDTSLALLFEHSVKPSNSSKKTSELPLTGKENTNHPEYTEIVNDRKLNRKTSKNNSSTRESEKSEEDGFSNKPSFSIEEPKPVEIFGIASSDRDRKRKRKRHLENDSLESDYLLNLARQDDKEQKCLKDKRKLKSKKVEISSEELKETEALSDCLPETDVEESRDTNPIHESLVSSNRDDEVEKASRTVFLANVSTLAITSKHARKTLLAHMASFLTDLPAPSDGKPAHKLESIRFRSTAFVGSGLPKKAAFARKKLMAATTKSTNAYVVYSNAYSAREAVKRLNGSIILDRHLRVDSVAHPSKTDHRRCVFVGNLGFVDDESSLGESDEMSRKRSQIPADAEEGLWRQFAKAGKVESVRVVRDEKTRVGKGFAYVQFTDPNSVESALLFNEKKYPPMLPRILRVVRAKAMNKTAGALAASQVKRIQNKEIVKPGIYNPKLSSEQLSLYGRASKLLGSAGAANLKKADGVLLLNRGNKKKKLAHKYNQTSEDSTQKLPKDSVFEGYRARPRCSQSGRSKLSNKDRIKGGKPKTRSSRRASEWRKNSCNTA